jgi:hypothetical protein
LALLYNNINILLSLAGNLLRMDMKLGHCTDPAVATEMGQKVDTIVVYYGT